MYFHLGPAFRVRDFSSYFLSNQTSVGLQFAFKGKLDPDLREECGLRDVTDLHSKVS